MFGSDCNKAVGGEADRVTASKYDIPTALSTIEYK